MSTAPRRRARGWPRRSAPPGPASTSGRRTTRSVGSQSALAGGPYTAVASQSDSAGNLGRSTITFSVDASADPKLIAAGDIGSCASTGDEATGQLLNSMPGTIAAVGDLAYDNGTAL